MVRVSRFSVEKFLSHRSQKICRGIPQCFIIFGYRKTLGMRGGGGGIYVFLSFFLSHSAENFRRGDL